MADPSPQLFTPAHGFNLRSYLAAFIKGDYAASFFRRVAGQALGVVVLIEAVFLAEHFTWVFRDAVRHEAGLFDISLVLMLTTTQIFDLALAIAVLIAAYATFMQMRENRELLVLFASGLGPYQLTSLIAIVAVLAQLAGVAGSGLADPLSLYAQRSILFGTELHSLKNGVAKGQFYYFPSYVAYATDHKQPATPGVIDARGNSDRTLFVYQQIAPHASRVVTAAKARLDGPDAAGKIILNLGDFTSHIFADAHPLGGPGSNPAKLAATCADCFQELKDIPRVTMQVRDMSQLMMVDQLLPFNRRGSDPAEQTVFDELAGAPTDAPDGRAAQMRLLAERFARSLLSLLAPLIALAGLCLTSRRTNWFALPLACLALMSVDLVSEWVITTVAPRGLVLALAPPALLAAAIAGLALWIIIKRQNELVRPQLAHA